MAVPSLAAMYWAIASAVSKRLLPPSRLTGIEPTPSQPAARAICARTASLTAVCSPTTITLDGGTPDDSMALAVTSSKVSLPVSNTAVRHATTVSHESMKAASPDASAASTRPSSAATRMCERLLNGPVATSRATSTATSAGVVPSKRVVVPEAFASAVDTFHTARHTTSSAITAPSAEFRLVRDPDIRDDVNARLLATCHATPDCPGFASRTIRMVRPRTKYGVTPLETQEAVSGGREQQVDHQQQKAGPRLRGGTVIAQ